MRLNIFFMFDFVFYVFTEPKLNFSIILDNEANTCFYAEESPDQLMGGERDQDSTPGSAPHVVLISAQSER